ncbi:MAG: lipid biosynthesis B12-binding/radical SAM protein [Pseudomonadota bacterium]
MKVLLVSANTITEPYPVYPLGLDYVAAAIADRHEVQIADMNSLNGYDALLEIIGRFSADVIGISLRNIDNTDTTDPKDFFNAHRELIQKIRDHSSALIVLGGSGFTIFPEEIMNALEADYGIIGEGERLSLLLGALENQKDTAAIPGVITGHHPKPVPLPWNKGFYRNFSKDQSRFEFYLKNGGMLNLQTKRGCSLNCIYCTYPHIEGSAQRLIDPAEVADTALQLQTAGAKYLFITDSTFNTDYAHTLNVARAFKDARVSIPWGAFFIPNKMPDDYFRILRDAGLTHVEFGTESLSNSVLASYRKPYQRSHVFAAHQSAIDAGLHVAHYFLLGGPGENADTLEETLSGITNMNKSVFFFFCGMRIYPYTKLYDIAVEQGQITRSQSLLEPVFYRSSAIGTEQIIRMVKARAEGHPNWIIGSGGGETAGIIAKMYKRGYTGPLWEYLIR